jgi:hypothetical protein
MLYKLFEFGKTIALGVLLNDYVIRNYPSKYREIAIDLAYNTIYVYSYCEMILKNGLQYLENKHPDLVKFIKKIYKVAPKGLDIEFIKDNQIVSRQSKQQYLDNKGVAVIPEYDFILYSDTCEKTCNIKVIRPNPKYCLLNESTYDYELSTIRFILLEFIVGEKSYKIDLSTNKHNFYVKDNILDKSFLLYYLRYIHPEAIIFEEDDIQLDEITIKLIDHNVDIKKISLTENPHQYFQLDSSSYEIITNL